MAEITLMSDERVAGIPVADVGEPFVDLREHPELVLDGRLADPRGAYARVRAGAAVDLTLRDADGAELPMGSEVNAGPEESDGACYTAAPGISAEARANRRLLSEVLTSAGLVNYPTEWWHWSYGDRYWALSTGRPAALHGRHDAFPGAGGGDDE